ncbi:hypothetical protein DRF59_17070 [Chryseobacterium flavum]|uniref:Uncharacterized protein n=1 Tax=Chryseobacterium flavum TaxID=415851 RepID=A0A3D9CHG8_9FLAO|nr:hypothetical protein DRF59_17070 [Chryseobacterium flavum]
MFDKESAKSKNQDIKAEKEKDMKVVCGFSCRKDNPFIVPFFYKQNCLLTITNRDFNYPVNV